MNFILYNTRQLYETSNAYFPEELFYMMGCKFGLLTIGVKKGGVRAAVLKNTKLWSFASYASNCMKLPYILN